MSNWQYANYTPIQQFRSANALPRELSLYTGEDKQLYLSAAPVKETEHLRKDSKKLDDFTVNGEKRLETLLKITTALLNWNCNWCRLVKRLVLNC